MASHQQCYDAAQTMGLANQAANLKEKESRMGSDDDEEKRGAGTGGRGVLQQAGQQIKSMAQGAAHALKDSFGFAEEIDDDDLPPPPTTTNNNKDG